MTQEEIDVEIKRIQSAIFQYNEGAVYAREMFAAILNIALEAYENIEPSPEEIEQNKASNE